MGGVTSLVLGLDVSPRRLGWGLCDLVTGEPVACGCESIDLPDHGWAEDQVKRALFTVEYAAENGFDDECEVQLVYFEKPALPPKSGGNSAFNAGRAFQAAWDEVGSRWPWAPREVLQPSSWRRFAGLPGNAPKAAVMEFARGLLAGVESQDAADALTIAYAGWRSNEEINERSEVA